MPHSKNGFARFGLHTPRLFSLSLNFLRVAYRFVSVLSFLKNGNKTPTIPSYDSTLQQKFLGKTSFLLPLTLPMPQYTFSDVSIQKLARIAWWPTRIRAPR